MNMPFLRLFPVALLAAFVPWAPGCSSGDSSGTDGAPAWDGSVEDASVQDASFEDAPAQDASAVDAGPTVDAGPFGPLSRGVPNALANSYAKAQQDHRLVVGYLGGSITEGAGASSSETSYRGRTSAWLRAQLPGVDVQEINAGVGGTGSDLGAFRCGGDVLAHDPDLVFVEFAVNDGTWDQGLTLIAMEGITRQIYAHDPSIDVVFLYTASRSVAADFYDQGAMYPTVTWHEQIAQHYGIPSINIGLAFWYEIAAGRATWDSLTVDGVHPNDAGYAIYADAIAATLAGWLALAPGETPAPKQVPAPLTDNSFGQATLVDSWTLEAPGWAQEAETLAGRYPHRIASATPGTELVYPFTGVAVGLYWLIAPDSGDIEWSIDDGPWTRTSSWDSYALSFTRAGHRLLRRDLLRAPHVLRIRVLAEHNAESTGSWIRIGALLVAY